MQFFSFSLDVFLCVLLRAAIAVVVGGIIGIERGKQGRAAGMRTHILVCLGATLTAMLGMYVYEAIGYGSDPLRISAQVISGIGFLGVGTILIKGRFQITGLTTAAGLWCTASIGVALGSGFYEGAAVVFLFAILSITILHRLEYKLTGRNTRIGVYVEISSDKCVRPIISRMQSDYKITDIQVTGPRSASGTNVGIEAIIHSGSKSSEKIIEELEKLEGVVFALESI